MATQDEAKKLDDELARLERETGWPGPPRERASLFGVSTPVLRHWLAKRNPVPRWAWIILKLYGLLTAEGREQFRVWSRDQAKKKS